MTYIYVILITCRSKKFIPIEKELIRSLNDKLREKYGIIDIEF